MLPHVEMAINSHVAASTGKSPSELTTGWRLWLPLDGIVGTDECSNASAANFAHRMQEMVAAARVQLERA